MSSVSVSVLESKLYDVLKPRIPISWILKPFFNKTFTPQTPLNYEKVFLIMGAKAGDRLEGKITSKGILSPIIGFSLYSSSFIALKVAIESFVGIMDNLNIHDFSTETQEVQNFFRLSRIPPVYDSENDLYLASFDYVFTISNVKT